MLDQKHRKLNPKKFFILIFLLVSAMTFAVTPGLAVTTAAKPIQRPSAAGEMIAHEFQARIERELKIHKLQEYLLVSGDKLKVEKTAKEKLHPTLETSMNP